MTDHFWNQCELGFGTTRDIAYIPARAAVVGKHVEIPAGSRRFWEVLSVSYPAVPYERVRHVQEKAREGFASTRG